MHVFENTDTAGTHLLFWCARWSSNL